MRWLRVEGRGRVGGSNSADNQGEEERKKHGNETHARTSTASPASIRSKARGSAAPGTRLVRQELLRGEPRGLHAPRGARHGKWRAGHDGAQLLGTRLRAAQLRAPSRRPLL